MEGLFEALLQFLFEIVFGTVCDLIGGIIENVLCDKYQTFLHPAANLNLPFKVSFFDEITKPDPIG